MQLIKLAKKLSQFCGKCKTPLDIYNVINDGWLHDFTFPLGPLNMAKLIFYIDYILNGKNPDDITHELDNNLYLFTIISFSSNNEVEIDCDSCSGFGRETCDDCGGSGELECGDCDGTGESDGETCDACDGAGQVDCDLCLGEKYFDCEQCDGRGYIEVNGVESYVGSFLTYNDDLLSKLNVGDDFDMRLPDLNKFSCLFLYEEEIKYDNEPSLVRKINSKYSGKKFVLQKELIEGPDDLYFYDDEIRNITVSDVTGLIEDRYT